MYTGVDWTVTSWVAVVAAVAWARAQDLLPPTAALEGPKFPGSVPLWQLALLCGFAVNLIFVSLVDIHSCLPYLVSKEALPKGLLRLLF